MGTRLEGRRLGAAVFALALLPRAAFLVFWQRKGLGGLYGHDLYYDLARSWLGWLPMPPFDATHPPLYTGFIAGVLGLFGSPNPLPVLVAQCLMGAASAVLVLAIGRRLADEKTALLAAAWVALDPPLVFFTPQLQTETLFVFMELVFFAGLLRLAERPASVKLAGLGFWGGLCVLCRSVMGAYPAFLFLAWWRARGLPRAFVLCALLGVGWLLPPALWGARNYHRYGRMVPLSGQMGWTLYEGFSLDRDEVRRRPYEMADEARSRGITDSLAAGRYFLDKTKALARAHPLWAAKIVLGKALLFWRPWPYDPYTPWQRVALGVYYVLLFGLALAGLRSVWGRPQWAPVWALFAYLTCVHAVFFTSLRYRLPLEPFLCLLAAAGARRLAAARSAGEPLLGSEP